MTDQTKIPNKEFLIKKFSDKKNIFEMFSPVSSLTDKFDIQ